ncbi:uncharacterized protein LOC117577610 isoform X2 [Drosophila albomicans]|uniref:Uncharacterized protein LOC117577610 isoform X2 n=1 Tax=Drosophila albomicans TaxID=7291 RepID=A0A6P8XQH1_DROAB|nr:uncharacterized protein LOC117577610 isoform X2 [Drosophila albomicans]
MTTTTATELSARGGFTARHNSRIQARKDHKLSKRSSPDSSVRLEATSASVSASATASTTSDQRLAHETPTATATTTCCTRVNAQQIIYSPLFTSHYLVLAVILLVASSSFPANTNASPIRLSGRHLILKHRHHVHLRAAVNTPAPTKIDCRMLSEQLINVTKLANDTKNEIEELLTIYAKNHSYENLNASNHFLSLQDLQLKHDLIEEVKANVNDTYDASDVKSLDEEVGKITRTLYVLHQLLRDVMSLNMTVDDKNTFSLIKEKVEHNGEEAFKLLKLSFDLSHTTMVDYNHDHIWPGYAAANHTLEVLRVIKKKYARLAQLLC